MEVITKTYLYNFDPLKPHFYIVKLGFTGVYIIFFISAQKHTLWYSLEPPRWGGSNEYPQYMFWAEIWKISEFFNLKMFSFLEVKFSIYLNRHVFVMKLACESTSEETESKYEFTQKAFSMSETCQIGSQEAVNVRRAGIVDTEFFLSTKCFTIFQNSFSLLLKFVNKENFRLLEKVSFACRFKLFTSCEDYTLPNRILVKFSLLSFF